MHEPHWRHGRNRFAPDASRRGHRADPGGAHERGASSTRPRRPERVAGRGSPRSGCRCGDRRSGRGAFLPQHGQTAAPSRLSLACRSGRTSPQNRSRRWRQSSVVGADAAARGSEALPREQSTSGKRGRRRRSQVNWRRSAPQAMTQPPTIARSTLADAQVASVREAAAGIHDTHGDGRAHRNRWGEPPSVQRYASGGVLGPVDRRCSLCHTVGRETVSDESIQLLLTVRAERSRPGVSLDRQIGQPFL